MTHPNSLHLDLQCTGVTPAPTIASPRLPKTSATEDALKQQHTTCESREPLHDSNSQPSLCGSNSQKRSHTTSQSIVITPSEKRQTMLALSPARPFPAGQQFTTLEVQRVLSLTPGTKPDFRRSAVQQGSQESMRVGCPAYSPPSCSPGSTAPAQTSPASHKGSGDTKQHTASPQYRPSRQPADAPHMLHDTCPATELQLADFPATQLVCAATALDLMVLQTTQIVTTDARAAGTCQPQLAVHCNHSSAHHALQHLSGPALGVEHADGCEPTPMLQLAALQDIEAVPHGRAPAGPTPSPSHSSPQRQDNKPAASNAHLESSVVGPPATATAAHLLPESPPEPLIDPAKPGTCNRPGRQQSQPKDGCQPVAAGALQPGRVTSLDPSSLATGMGTEDASLSQESLDGTQAEADALMEEAAFAFMHGSDDQAEGCLMLNISTTTLHEVASALGLSYDAWARSHRFEDLVKVERAIWAARLHEKLCDELARFSFEGRQIVTSLPELSGWVRDELCDASEAAQRLAEWHATGRISSFSDQVPFSCSAAGSSADPFDPPEGTQLGTVLEQAAAIISYSQVVHDHTSPGKLQQPPAGLLSQAVLHAAQTQKRGMPQAPPSASQTDSAAAAAVNRVLQSLPDQAGAVDAAPKATAAQLPAQTDQETDQGNAAPASSAAAPRAQSPASQSGAVQGQTRPHSAPGPTRRVPADVTDAKAAVAPAQESQTQAAAVASAAVLQDDSAHQILAAAAKQKSAAASSEQAPAGVPAAEAAADDSMSQETFEDLGDIGPTEVQLPDHASLLHAAASQDQASPAPIVAPASPAGRHGDLADEAHQADADACPEPAVGAGKIALGGVSVHEPLPTSLPGSPTQDLHLQLTYLGPEPADHHAEPAAEAASQQLRLQLATEPSMAHDAADVQDASCQDVVGSPAQLDLNLDTQLPDLPAEKAELVSAPVGGQKKSPQPALKRGWWNQPWSVAQHAEDVDSLPAVGMWGVSTCDDAAAGGTEVTPSGLRPSRGHSLTPLPHPPSKDAAPKQPALGPPGKGRTKVPQGRSPPQSLIIADSEEPLVLARSNGPARKAFLDAHALPCSSPNSSANSPAKSPAKSPTDPLCSYVPATADGTSPHKNAQKRCSSPKAHTAMEGREGRLGSSPTEGRFPTVAQAGPALQHEQRSNGHFKSRPGKKKGKGKVKAAAPQMGPPGGRYRAGLPAPRYQSHPTPPPPRIAPAPSSTRHLTDKRSVGGQVQPGSAQQSSPQIAAAVRQQQQPDALPTCTMEQLPPGGTAFNAAFNSAVNSPFNGCTMEQLPSGRHTASPSEAASPIQLKVFNSPATMLRHRQGNGSTPGGQQQQEQCRGEGVEQGQRVGVGQGLPGVGLFARNAAAAFCSARRQTLEPRNPYSFDDSQSEAADPDAAHPPVPPQRASAVGASGHKPQIEAQQAKHAGMGREGVPKGPPQQSRCKWQTKGFAQAAADEAQPKKKQGAGGAVAQQPRHAAAPAPAAAAAAQADDAKHATVKGGKKRRRGSGSIALDKPVRKRQPPPRWDDMVGHSQLDSDMLEAWPALPAAADNTVAKHVHAAEADEAPMADNETDDQTQAGTSAVDEALQGAQSSPAPLAAARGSPMHVPQPGRKRKRSGPRGGGHQGAAPADLPDSAAEPDEQDAAHPEAAADISAQPVSQAQMSSVKIPPLGCSKCRYGANGCKKCRSDQAEALQAAAAAQAEVAAPFTAVAAADIQGKQPAAAGVRPLRSSCPAATAPPKDPPRQRRQSRRHSSGQGLLSLGQGDPGAAIVNACADAAEEEDMAAGQGLASANGQMIDRRVTFATPNQGAARLYTGKQGKAGPHSPAVPTPGDQQLSRGQRKADQRLGRASLSSPALGSGGPRQHRRASLGGGGVLPLAGHSFLLTAYADDKQKKIVTQRITQLGGCVLEDIPKPSGPRQASLGGNTPHPVLAVIASVPKRTHKVMYACIKGIPTLKESWLAACVAAHKLLPFDAFHQDGSQRSKGHQAFQGLAMHLAGAPSFQHTWSGLIRHAGGEIVGGVGDVTSPSKGWHHALQGPCHCILSDFKLGSEEDRQVQRLARRLRLPVKDAAWAVIGFETGALPALPLPSPTKASPTKPCNPPSSPSIALPSPAVDQQLAPGADPSGDSTDVGPRHTLNTKPGAVGRAKKRRRSLALPESQPQHQQEARNRARTSRRAPPAGPMDDSRGQLVEPGSAEKERAATGGAASTSEVVADSLEVGSCVAHALGVVMDDVSSADTGRHEWADAQQAQREALQGQHPAQQPSLMTVGEQGRAVAAAGQLAGAGQLLSGNIQWVGPSIDPPTHLGLAPSQHQTYYKAFSKGGLEVKVGDCVEVSQLGDDTTRLLQLKALWSEPTQARHRMQAFGQYFYRAQDTRLPQHIFPQHEVFSSGREETVALAAVMCRCSIIHNASPAVTGSHIYHCHFAYNYESNALTPSNLGVS